LSLARIVVFVVMKAQEEEASVLSFASTVDSSAKAGISGVDSWILVATLKRITEFFSFLKQSKS